MAEAKSKKPQSRISKLYAKSGDKLERKGKFCPKCGAGVFMAQHKDRLVCGRCGYSEFQGRTAAPRKKEKKEFDAPKIEQLEDMSSEESME